jgi:hypothetical protein
MVCCVDSSIERRTTERRTMDIDILNAGRLNVEGLNQNRNVERTNV